MASACFRPSREAKNDAPDDTYDYAILTGDYLVHESRKLFEPFGGKDEKAYEDFVLKAEVFTAREVQKNLPGVPVYFCLGNNDSECGDYMFATKSDFLRRLSKEWGVLAANPAAAACFSEMGNYVLPHPKVSGMELISLNDVYWSNRFSEDSCYPQSGDPGQAEMDWLGSQLKDAKAKHLKVQLIMHIPPGADVFATYMKMKTQGPQLFWAPKYQREFLDLVKAYPELLVCGFAGHTHMDDFRVLDRGPGKAPFFIHICPAVSPIRGNNPELQVALYDREHGGHPGHGDRCFNQPRDRRRPERPVGTSRHLFVSLWHERLRRTLPFGPSGHDSNVGCHPTWLFFLLPGLGDEPGKGQVHPG